MSGLRALRRRQPRFDSALAAVADAAREPTEHIPVVDMPTETLVVDREPELVETVVPDPEPPLPHAGYAIGPQILTEHPEWRWVFPSAPAPEDASRYGWVDVSEATREDVEALAGDGFIEWLDDGRGVMVHTGSGRTDLAHMGDRLVRDTEGLHVQCTRAFGDWETGEFAAADAAIAGGDDACS